MGNWENPQLPCFFSAAHNDPQTVTAFGSNCVMRYISISALLLVSVLIPSSVFGATGIAAPDVAVGYKLQMSATLVLDQPAPDDGLDIVLQSSDPVRLLISKRPDQRGAASVTIRVRKGYRESPEFWLQALGGEGAVKYTASAQGLSGAGTVTLAPSGIAILGPYRIPKFPTTPRAEPSQINIFSARLDSSLQFAEEQTVAGGSSVKVELINSNPSAGTITTPSLEIGGGFSSASTEFRPAGEGETTLSARVPPGFSAPAKFATVTASVNRPGLAASDHLVIGQNLQVSGVLSLGELASTAGVSVKLVSDDPSKLLLSNSETAIGSKSITIEFPPGGGSLRYYLQALDKSGTVTYTATASGYRSRTAEITLAPSGIVITPWAQGPPDEAHVLRKVAPESNYKFFAELSKPVPTHIVAWTAYLDPVTLRSADITVQPLRAGLSLTIPLTNSNPAVGSVVSQLIIPGGSDHAIAEFKAIGAGETEISVTTPKDFTRSDNSTTVTAIVRK
jgi:hypothetical protein